LLAFHWERGQRREEVLEHLWPDVDVTYASQSLSSLLYSIRRTLADALGGSRPVAAQGGRLLLAANAGVRADLAWFDSLAALGHGADAQGDRATAVKAYRRAIELYRGELDGASDLYVCIEQARIHARLVTMIGRVADHLFKQGEYEAAMAYARRLVMEEPCREDGHRLIMRCYVARGERALALRQFRVCEEALRMEFGATPEDETTSLFDAIRRPKHERAREIRLGR
jgi:DNA-binding SARP family transcriptional activator